MVGLLLGTEQLQSFCPPQALDAAELEKEQLRRGHDTRPPASSDWLTVVPPSDCTPPPEPQPSPHQTATLGEDTTTLPERDSSQDRNLHTASVNGDLQGSAASPRGGCGESATPSSGRCAAPSWPAVTRTQPGFLVLNPDLFGGFFFFFLEVGDTSPAEAKVMDPEQREHQLTAMDDGTGDRNLLWFFSMNNPLALRPTS